MVGLVAVESLEDARRRRRGGIPKRGGFRRVIFSGTTLGYKEEAELWESRAAVLTQEREALREECAAKDGELLVLRERLEALESAARVASPAGSSAGSSESPPPSRGNHPRG